eukprot:scaffold162415_cov21-Tisochrysis_lutea.AAC.1
MPLCECPSVTPRPTTLRHTPSTVGLLPAQVCAPITEHASTQHSPTTVWLQPSCCSSTAALPAAAHAATVHAPAHHTTTDSGRLLPTQVRTPTAAHCPIVELLLPAQVRSPTTLWCPPA